MRRAEYGMENNMISLENGDISVLINTKGAELKSLKRNGKEYLWQGIPEIWSGTAPLLFPICGGLKDDKFIFDGKEYTLQKHGYIRFCEFEVEKKESTSATFLHRSDKDTYAVYPFNYELRVIYTLTDSGVRVTYRVDNTDTKQMYFSIGSHEGYVTPEGIEDYDIIFPEKETLNSVILDGNLLEKHSVPIIKDSNVLPLYDKYFTLDALVFKKLKSRSATLRNRKTGRFVKVDFPDKPYFLLWHKHAAPYICLEPWCGIPDAQDSNYDLTKKEGIISLPSGKTYEISHFITVGEE